MTVPSWYGDRGYFPPYVPVATKKALAARELAKLAKAGGREPEPIVVTHRKRRITTTFWGTAWCDNLARYADLANRLPRGRTYVRNGYVIDLTIDTGRVEARVLGSELYTVTIGMAPMARKRWRHVVSRCSGRIGSLVSLLRAELSDDVMAVLADAKEGLFPEPREMTLACSCPDPARLCKHIAAVLYGVGIRLDEKPALFFTLRQIDEHELVSSATSAAVSRPRGGAGKRIAADRLADVFGIDLADEPLARAAPVARAPRRSASAPSPVRRPRSPRSRPGSRGGRGS